MATEVESGGKPSIHPTAVVDPDAQIGDGTQVGPYCVIGPGVRLGKNNILKPHVVIEGPSVIGNGNQFFPGASVGMAPQDLKYAGEKTELKVGDSNIFRECVSVNRGTVGGGALTTVGSHSLFMAYCHVAHDCTLGDHVIMANAATLAGHVKVEDHATIGGLTPVHQFARIGLHAFIGGLTRVSQDVVPYARVGGIPPVHLGANSIGLQRVGVKADAIKDIEKALKILFRSGLNTSQALKKINEFEVLRPEVQRIIDFVESSERGILR